MSGRERPILMNGESVRQLLAGTKTQTRRVVTWKHSGMPATHLHDFSRAFVDRGFPTEVQGAPLYRDQYLKVPCAHPDDGWDLECLVRVYAPFGSGDVLWVRETWADLRGMGFGPQFAYKADSLTRDGREDADSKRCRLEFGVRWKPSIHMPRDACRVRLLVTSVRPERLVEISEDDARAEGSESIAAFRERWDSINGGRRGMAWDQAGTRWSGWVWVIAFERVEMASGEESMPCQSTRHGTRDRDPDAEAMREGARRAEGHNVGGGGA